MKKHSKQKEIDTEAIYQDSIGSTYKYNFFNTLRIGFAEKYIEAFGNFLNASNFHFTLLVSFPQFLGGILQLFTFEFLKFFRTRKRMNMFTTFSESTVWIPILLLALLKSRYAIWGYIGLVTIYFCLTLVENPVYNSWIMDLVSMERRGKYLARQTIIVSTVTLLSFIIGGFILEEAAKLGRLATGFILIFSIAIFFNLFGMRYLSRTHEPPFTLTKPKTSIKKFISEIRYRPEGKAMLYLSLMSFSVYISAPFYTLYLLRTLQFDYFRFAILMMLPILMRIVFIKKVGFLVDKFGPKKMLEFTSLLVAIVPMLWLIHPSFFWLIFVQIYAGVAMGSYEVSALTFMINETNSLNRISLMSYYNFFNGCFVIAGALMGNLFSSIGPFHNAYLNAFLFSGLSRIIVLLMAFPRRMNEKDFYTKTTCRNLGTEIFSVASPSQLMCKMVAAKDILNMRLSSNKHIPAKLGNGSVLRIEPNKETEKYPVPKKKEAPLPPPPEKPHFTIYFCKYCRIGFKKRSTSTIKPKCPLCGSTTVKLIGRTK
ncbi:MFS transporter [Candidatus Woesearchaeota archaeon]|nr:MFS transporter [Candidatus Woesearchaeota archaeon]